MKEDQHRNLLWALRDRLPLDGITPTHVVNSDHFPDPPLIDGHQPDLIAESRAGTMVIGTAKEIPDLGSDLSAAEFRAFASYRDPKSDELAALVVVVRKEHREDAEKAIEKAGVGPDRCSILAVGFPDSE
ncbi:MAG TPA: hypothetical protein VHQ43_01610 [Solirubrobacterales bacterium]|jgi:hypothetical protein|nr:hypothetical protein [Solirubrobacterales bacterium]